MKIISKTGVIISVALISIIIVLCFGKPLLHLVYLKIIGEKTSASVYKEIGDKIELKLNSYFEKSNINYPPKQITLIALKDEQLLEVWATQDNQNSLIHTYNFTGFSGKLGPKLMEGDKQIPEGLYKIEYLNPNSRFHLSMKISYPNKFDKVNGELDGRNNLGGDIMIHGSNCTIGCIPIGDSHIEELFTLVYKTGIENVSVIIAPNDIRIGKPKYSNPSLKWIKEKYQRISKSIIKYEK